MNRKSSLSLIFFEDSLCHNFKPLSLTRPVDDLRIGLLTLREKWTASLDSATAGRFRQGGDGQWSSELASPTSEEYLIINSRLIPGEKILSALNSLQAGQALFAGKTFVAARLKEDDLQTLLSTLSDSINAEGADDQEDLSSSVKPFFKESLPIPEAGLLFIESIPDMLDLCGSEIEQDIARKQLRSRGENLELSPRAILDFEKSVYIGNRTKIEPGAILLAKEGPIVIGEGSTIMAGAVIRGPVCIGPGSTVKSGAKIYGDTVIGPVCKIAGEVQNTIFHSYCNKAHDGFVGNSVFGQWCNLGADTNTSNLKNNYSSVSMTDWETGRSRDTGRQFLGTIMGDHSKTGINTMLNTGTVCGVSCNIFGAGFPPKFIPSFSWVDGTTIEPYRFEKAAETMKKVMSRRNVHPTDDYLDRMRQIAEKSRS